jgi:hypothetical protein
MKCPIDGNDLLMTERSGVEIDYCPKCRGIWLDRGELDKILEKAEEASSPEPFHVKAHRNAPPDPGPAIPNSYEDARRRHARVHEDLNDRHRDDYRGRKDYKHDKRYGKRKKREGVFDMIEDIFDF